MNIPIQVILKEAEVVKIDPKPGEVLVFKFKGDEFVVEDIDELGRQLRVFFPNNKVVVMTLPSHHDVELTVVQNQDKIEQPAPSCAEPTAYCNSCGCGKKERILAEQAKKE
jgi:hypothetical protein